MRMLVLPAALAGGSYPDAFERAVNAHNASAPPDAFERAVAAHQAALLVVASPGFTGRARSPGMKAGTAAQQPLPGKIAARLREAKWLALVAVAAYLALILGTFNRTDPGWSHSAAVER